MSEILDVLGFRHVEEEAWPGARAARRRRLDLGRRQQVAAPAARVCRERERCLGGSPAPPYIGGGAGRPRGREWSPSPTRLGGAPAWGGGTPSPSRFQTPPPLSENCRLTFKLAV